MSELFKMMKTQTTTELKDGTFTLQISGLPKGDADDNEIAIRGALVLVTAYDSLENWVQEKIGQSVTLSAAVEEARSILKMKSKYEKPLTLVKPIVESKPSGCIKCGCHFKPNQPPIKE